MTYNITLDIKKSGYQTTIDGFKCGDNNTRDVVISLAEGGKAYTIPEDTSAIFCVELPDGTKYNDTCYIVDNKLTHTFLYDELAQVGEVKCEVRLTKGSDILTAPTFKVNVVDVIYDAESAEGHEKFDKIGEALERVLDVEKGLPKKIDKVTNAVNRNLPMFKDGSIADSGLSADDILPITEEDVAYWNNKQDEIKAGDGILVKNNSVSLDYPTVGDWIELDYQVLNKNAAKINEIAVFSTSRSQGNNIKSSGLKVSDLQDAITPDNKLDYSLISNTPTIPTVPTKVSAFTNDAGYLTQHQDISGKQDKITSSNKLPYSLISGTPTIPDISGKQDKLTAGQNITIEGNVISASGGGGGSIPEITITYSQFISENELVLTDEQNTILTTNTFVTINASAVGMGVFGVQTGVTWNGDTYAIANVAIWSDRIENGRIYLLLISNKIMTIMQTDFPIGEIPSNVSAFTNDSGYLTLDTLPKYNGGVN